MKKKILYGLIIILIIIQFFRIDKTNPIVNLADDFIEITNPPKEITTLLKSSCYDCHSNESTYPWYSNVAPISWWVKDHINEGREELNFSKWSTYDAKKKDHKLKEIIEEVEEGEMPLKPYPLTHPEARLSTEQKEELTTWFKKTRAELNKPKQEKTLQLNNGEKWPANPETTTGISRMLDLISDSKINHTEMGESLNIEMKIIFNKCTMKGEAHDQLHLYLIPLVKMFRNLKEEKENNQVLIRQNEIKTYLNTYSIYFK